MSKKTVAIRNRRLPKQPRVFDVVVTETGRILEYEIKNIRGCLCVDADDVEQQIQAALRKAG